MKDSELILNKDGSIYHLGIQPENLANLIITVGDPNRVPVITKHFDQIRFKHSQREFVTHTGNIGNLEITCISTGMGSGNIDIVLNELDALKNIDFDNRIHKSNHEQLSIVRIGTSGSMSSKVDVDEILFSEVAIGLEGIMLWYDQVEKTELEMAWLEALLQANLPIQPYVREVHDDLSAKFANEMNPGITLTTAGFYAPQSRNLRLKPRVDNLFEKLGGVVVKGRGITNIEMETAAIYGLASALGHRSISVNAILANRLDGNFSSQPEKTVEKAIVQTLDILCN